MRGAHDGNRAAFPRDASMALRDTCVNLQVQAKIHVPIPTLSLVTDTFSMRDSSRLKLLRTLLDAFVKD